MWIKETVVDRKARNQDPRWQLRLTLERDGRLSYESRSTTEIWLTNGQARSSSEQISIAGRWSFNDRGEIVIELGRKPTPAETLQLSTNLNFDATAGRALVVLDFAGALLRLSGLPGDREIYFKKVKNL